MDQEMENMTPRVHESGFALQYSSRHYLDTLRCSGEGLTA